MAEDSKADTKKVLIIEDNATILEMYRLKFMKTNFTFFEATTGERGIEIAKTEKPDVVFVDLLLENKVEGGKMNGFACLAELIKLRGKSNAMHVYVLTNLNQDADVKKAFKEGADGFLVKSDLTPQQLVDATNDILAGKKVGIEVGQ